MVSLNKIEIRKRTGKKIPKRNKFPVLFSVLCGECRNVAVLSGWHGFCSYFINKSKNSKGERRSEIMIYDLNWHMELILRIMIASVLGNLIGF